MKQSQALNQNWQRETRGDLVLDGLQSTAAGNRAIRTILLSEKVMYSGFTSTSIESQLQVEKSSFLPAASAVLLRLTKTLKPAISAGLSLARSVRNPSLNELYWSPGGNPDLKPEILYKALLFFSTQANPASRFRGELYYRRSFHLIQWTPVTTFWTPVNIQETQRLGIKGRWEWSLRRFTGMVVTAYSRSCNLSAGDGQGKRLLYAPDFVVHHTINWQFSRLAFQWQSDYRSQMISRYDWPEDVRINPVMTHSLAVHITKRVRHNEFTLSLEVRNLTDRAYEYSRGYPEMGRNIHLTLTLK